MNIFLSNFHQSDPYFKTDAYGKLIPINDQKQKIPRYNKLVLENIIENVKELLKENLVAVYFRGSRITNMYRSDFDTVVVVENETKIDIARKLSANLSGKFYNVIHYDTIVITRKQIQNDRSLQFVLRVLSVHVYGEDIHSKIDDFVIDNSLIFFIPKLSSKINLAKSLLNSKPNKADQNRLTNHIIKVILRSCFELVIEYEKKYTRDLQTCRDTFCKYFPLMSNSVDKIYDNYDKFITNDNLKLFMNESEYLVEFINNEFSKKNYEN